MSYVIAAYLAVFGSIGFYAARLVLRSRSIAARVLKNTSEDSNS